MKDDQVPSRTGFLEAKPAAISYSEILKLQTKPSCPDAYELIHPDSAAGSPRVERAKRAAPGSENRDAVQLWICDYKQNLHNLAETQ